MIQHPMIVDVYGGPDSSSVTNRWSMDWGTYLVSAKNYIYVRIDGRGSGLKGDEVLFKLYRQLGTVEVHDQIETAMKLQQKHAYIDSKRSAIWGWSYGGYVSGMSLTNDHDGVFKCAVSVAPGEKF
jgi:dipeptidyl-peptidase 4